MSKMYKENGFLSPEGKSVVAPLEGALEALLSSPEVREMSETELRTLGGVLSNIIGNAISNVIVSRSVFQSNLDKMTDEQFELFMKTKYGDRWILQSVLPEELKRSARLNEQKNQDLLDEIHNLFYKTNIVRMG